MTHNTARHISRGQLKFLNNGVLFQKRYVQYEVIFDRVFNKQNFYKLCSTTKNHNRIKKREIWGLLATFQFNFPVNEFYANLCQFQRQMTKTEISNP